jgi:hypothetical protein
MQWRLKLQPEIPLLGIIHGEHSSSLPFGIQPVFCPLLQLEDKTFGNIHADGSDE